MPDCYKSSDPVDSWAYYLGAKRKFAKWKHSPTPQWWKDNNEMADSTFNDLAGKEVRVGDIFVFLVGARYGGLTLEIGIVVKKTSSRSLLLVLN